MKDEYMIVSNVNRCIITGDTVQIGGAGTIMCDPTKLLKAMDIMWTLPDDTKMFCKHEHARLNWQFCLNVDNRNPHTMAHVRYYEDQRLGNIFNNADQGIYSVPFILKKERLYNVFMKCRDLHL